MSRGNFVPLLFFKFHSEFLIILSKTETFLDLVSDIPAEEVATVLHLHQYAVKMYVRHA